MPKTATMAVESDQLNKQEASNGEVDWEKIRAPDDGKYVSEEVYWEEYYEYGDVNYEWNNGILEAKPLSDPRKARLFNWFQKLITQFLEVYPIAQFTNLEIGFRIQLPDPDNPGKLKKQCVNQI
ncbi:hypothetical protein KFU94_63865 [Chloroflexi bacterium TSY]|nr:hypothetical protein [Chloroflexi bacterium TSY]